MDRVAGKKREDILQNLEQTYFGPAPDHRSTLEKTAISLCDEIFGAVGSNPWWFTDHGPTHSDRVLFYALKLAHRLGSCVQPLNPTEALFLAASVYLHDIGMAFMPLAYDASKGLTDDLVASIRTDHPHAVERVLADHSERFTPLRQIDDRAFQLLPELCRAHATSLFSEKTEMLAKEAPNDVRMDYLARLLLLADELDLTAHRAPESHPHFDQLPDVALMHWLRHHYIYDVVVDLPRVDIYYAFPGSVFAYGSFIRWTEDKIRQQTEMVQQGLPAGCRDVFDLEIRSTPKGDVFDRRKAPPAVVELVRREVEDPVLDGGIGEAGRRTRLRRPRQFQSHGAQRREESAVKRAIATILDDGFRGLGSMADAQFLEQAYVRIRHNDNVLEVLSERIQSWITERIDSESLPPTEPPRKIQFVTGGIGVGKSTLLKYLLEVYMPQRSAIFRDHCFWCVIDCMGKDSSTEVIRTAVDRISACCRGHFSPEQIEAFSAKGILRWESDTVDLNEEQCRARLKNLLRAIQFPEETEGLAGFAPRFAVVAFDNIDRMSDLSVTARIFEYALSLTKETRALILYPVRHSTKMRIDDQGMDEASNRAEIEVRAPEVGDILKARIAWTVGRDNPAHRIYAARVKAHLGRIGDMDVDLDDVGRALSEAMTKLTDRWEEHRLIPELAGQNLRSAFDMFRQILLSPWVSADEFLTLRTGELHHPYRLLQYLMRGDYESYQQRFSPILNLFDITDSDGLYFSKMRVLDVVLGLQEGEPGDDYVQLQRVHDLAKEIYGFSSGIIDREIWAMLTAQYRLFELQHVDDQLPSDQIGSAVELEGSFAIRANSCGRLYREHLVYQLSYIQTILEDTLLPLDVSREMSLPLRASWTSRCDAVRSFLDFLREREEIERVSYPSAAVRAEASVVQEIRSRVEEQIDKIGRSRNM